MKHLDFSVIDLAKVLIKYNNVTVMVDFSGFDPEDQPASGAMKAGGVTVVVKG